MSKPDLAIVGGGLLGRLLAWRAALNGLRVTLYEANGRAGHGATAWVAGGMVTPQAEAAEADPELVAMGRRSLALWPIWLSELKSPVHFNDSGTLMLWHRNDSGEAKRFESVLKSRDPHSSYERLDAGQVAAKEPLLQDRFREALFLPGEAHIDNRQLLPALAEALEDCGVQCHWEHFVDDTEFPDADLVIDCRGKGAKSHWKELRGVRGEIVRLHAPGIELRHMIRLLHPRHSIYMISRPSGSLVVGATSVESDDGSPISVHGALELLSTAYAVLPELGDARIIEMNCDCRPVLPDNRPKVRHDAARGLLEVNGLFRHGFLLSPAVVEEVLALLPDVRRNLDLGVSPRWPWLIERQQVAVCQ
ncbi:MAG: glycine oxidase ThiO [Acidobacteriaceae bacterium]